jgi:mono/diheme cytochrome c family protein
MMTAKAVFGGAMAALVGAMLLQAWASAQTTGPKNPSLVISSMAGRDLFEFYCAACHGRDGKGGGPVVPALRVAPADLTTIATRNAGTFPQARVESLVTGDQDHLTPAHGSKDMPVWGPIFRGLDPNETANRVRIANIVGYIESIQAK